MRNKRIQVDNKNITVLQYAGVLDKMLIVDLVCQTKTIDENGNVTYNHMLKEIITEYLLVKTYTKNIIDDGVLDDLSFDKIFVEYDELSESGVIQKVITNIPQREIDMIYRSIDNQIEENTKQPNLMTSIKNLFNNLNFDQEEMNQLIKSFNNINPDNKEILVEVLKQINKDD